MRSFETRLQRIQEVVLGEKERKLLGGCPFKGFGKKREKRDWSVVLDSSRVEGGLFKERLDSSRLKGSRNNARG